MKERPILFNDEMVRAILDGRKTQTRRPVTPAFPPHSCRYEINGNHDAACCIYDDPSLPGGIGFCPPTGRSKDHLVRCPFGSPGDRLWVREAWELQFLGETDVPSIDGVAREYSLDYGADGAGRQLSYEGLHEDDPYADLEARGPLHGGWRPSIHMPRWASRLTLEVKAVRVERLQEISEDAAEAEGVPRNWIPGCKGWSAEEHGFLDREGLKATKEGREILEYGFFTAREAFQSLWDSIYSTKGLGWDANPYVWVVEFERVKGKKGEGDE